MADFPTTAIMLIDGYMEKFDPSVLRTDMDRGMAKQRKKNTFVVKEIPLTLYFKTLADSDAFEDWYNNEIGRVAFFNWTHPVRGTTHQARFKSGDIGSLMPSSAAFRTFTRVVTLEYLSR